MPREVVLLSGIDNDLFWTGFCDDPFRLIGIYHVYLAPGSPKAIEPHPEWGCNTSKFFVDLDDAVPLLRNGQSAVFALEGRQVRDVTRHYLKTASAQDYRDGIPTSSISPIRLYQNRLGPTWYPAERGYRWMPKTATVENARARQKRTDAGGQRLLSRCGVARKGRWKSRFEPMESRSELPRSRKPDQLFTLKFALPSAIAGHGP